jgi:hypothetical protein
MFTTDSVARLKVLGGMAWCHSPEEADLRRRPMCAPKHHDHDRDARNAPEGYRQGEEAATTRWCSFGRSLNRGDWCRWPIES